MGNTIRRVPWGNQPPRGNTGFSLLRTEESDASDSSDSLSRLELGTYEERKDPFRPQHFVEVGCGKLPDDCFIHIFEMLSPADIGRCAQVSFSWRYCAYSPSLWSTLNLKPIFHTVDTRNLESIVKQARFREVEVLNMSLCSEVRSVRCLMKYLPRLRTLIMLGCSGIDAEEIPALVQTLPLERLELFLATTEYDIVPDILQSSPNIDLGFFWLAYCAATGTRLDNTGPERCRYEGMFNSRGCWGSITGRMIVSNQIYPLGGNFPEEVLFSCQNHKEEDFADVEYRKCQVCNQLLLPASFQSDVVCKVCYDFEVLYRKDAWIPLDTKTVNHFGVGELMQKVSYIAQRKNLPSSLRHFATVPVRLNLAEVDRVVDEDHKIDMADVPLSAFVRSNGFRLTRSASDIRGALGVAHRRKKTRALLINNENDDIEVLADANVILRGRRNVERMMLTTQAWKHSLAILYPLLFVLVLSFHSIVALGTMEQEDAQKYSGEEEEEEEVSPLLMLALGGLLLLLFVATMVLIMRYREQCERLFRKFLVLDIFMIFLFGGGSLLSVFVRDTGAHVDILSFGILCLNFAAGGVTALYYPVPQTVHRYYLVMLNLIMAVMLAVALKRYIVGAFVLIMSVGDVISELHSSWRPFSPFLVPPSMQLMYDTPSILYTVGNLRIRAAELTWYGLLMGVVYPTWPDVVIGITVVMAAMAIVVFVLPFYSKFFRPLPIAFGLLGLSMMTNSTILFPFLAQIRVLPTLPDNSRH